MRAADMSVVVRTYQKDNSLYLCMGNAEIVSLRPPQWRPKLLMAHDVGLFHFDAPSVTPVNHCVEKLPPPGTRLYSTEVCMYGDLTNEKHVTRQFPPEWLANPNFKHKVFYTWRSMNRWDVHFVTIWSDIHFDPALRWKHLEGIRFPTCRSLDDDSGMHVYNRVLYQNNRRVGGAKRSIVIAPREFKGGKLRNFCAFEMLCRYRDHIPIVSATLCSHGFVRIRKITDSDHMNDCAYDVVLAYLNK